MRQPLPRPDHRRRHHLVGGEHPGRHRPRVANDQGQVGRPRRLEPAGHPGRPEPGRRRHLQLRLTAVARREPHLPPSRITRATA